MCRNDMNVPAVNIKEARKCFTLFFNDYDYTLSYQKSNQYLKS